MSGAAATPSEDKERSGRGPGAQVPLELRHLGEHARPALGGARNAALAAQRAVDGGHADQHALGALPTAEALEAGMVGELAGGLGGAQAALVGPGHALAEPEPVVAQLLDLLATAHR